MALKKLSVGEMINLSSPWVKGPVRELLAAIPEVQPLLARIDDAHQALLAQPMRDDGKLAELGAEAARVDAQHDDILRGIHAYLSGVGYLMDDDPAHQAEVVALLQHLMPAGLSAIQRSYREEAGDAILVQARLSARDRALLAELPLPKGAGGKLKAAVDRWIAVATELGHLEDQRAALTQAVPSGVSGTDVVQARNRWIRMANALASNLELAEVGEESVARILGPLREAERAADRRGGRRGAESPPATTPETVAAAGGGADKPG